VELSVRVSLFHFFVLFQRAVPFNKAKSMMSSDKLNPPLPAGKPGLAGSVVHRRLQKRYDQLWLHALGPIRTGAIELDPILRAGVKDRRRGLTIIARPSLTVRRSVSLFLRELRRIEPDRNGCVN
jgi:hypothetical protein